MAQSAGDLGVAFRKVFDPQGDESHVYRCVPILGIGENIPVGKGLLECQGDRDDVARRNVAVLKLAFAEIAQAFQRGERARLIVPVSAEGLKSKAGANLIVAAFRELEPDIRAAVIPDLFGFAAEPMLGDVEDVIIPLLPFFESFIGQPHEATDDFTVFANCNFQGVTRDLEGMEWSVDDAMRELKEFWAVASSRRLDIYLQGVSSLGPADLAKRYNAKGMDGLFLSGNLDCIEDAAVSMI